MPCSAPDVVADANFTETNADHSVGTVVTYTCYPRYALSDGDLARTCVVGPAWTGATPTCGGRLLTALIVVLLCFCYVYI